ncbi:hypothetical protein ACIA8G_24865 [Lentzea sp. NPDC051213]|uniref:hypothetical protein n=1 Tax=Lentzea sp. NPDC051213 TaxID=3364126 RepID=UPI0037B2486E
MTEAVTESDAEADVADEQPPAPPPAGPGLHQPKRGLIAAAEVVVVVALVFVAVWCWNRGIVHLAYPIEGREPLMSTRYHGNWLGTAVGAITLAVLLALDAVRQVVLALRTRPQKAADSDM